MEDDSIRKRSHRPAVSEGVRAGSAVACKRQHIDLACPSFHSPKKCGRRRDIMIESCRCRATQPTPPTLQNPQRARVPRPQQTCSLAPPSVLPVAVAPHRLPARGPPRPAPRQTAASGARPQRWRPRRQGVAVARLLQARGPPRPAPCGPCPPTALGAVAAVALAAARGMAAACLFQARGPPRPSLDGRQRRAA